MNFKNSFLVSAFASLLFGCVVSNVEHSQVEPAVAVQTDSQKQVNAVGSENQEEAADAIVCKYRRPTGSRIPKKECMSEKSWAKIEQSSKDAREKLNKPAYNRINEN